MTGRGSGFEYIHSESTCERVVAMKLRFDGMSTDELWNLHEEIGKILSDRISSEKRELERRLIQLKRDYPVANSGDRRDKNPVESRRKYPQVLAKYRNPDSPHETWAGRGKQPRWVVTALKAGKKIEDLLISGAASRKNKAREKAK